MVIKIIYDVIKFHSSSKLKKKRSKIRLLVCASEIREHELGSLSTPSLDHLISLTSY